MSNKQTTQNLFNSDGRLLHAELALKNVEQAGTIAGLVCTDGVIILGINPNKSNSTEKIYKINDEIYLGVAGIFSDALRLIKFARLTSANFFEEIEANPRLSTLCETIAKEKQYFTQLDGARPFGVAFLYCGYEDGDYCLYSTDPSGTVNRWKSYSFGLDSEKINGELRNILLDSEKTSIEIGISSLMNAISKAREWNDDVVDRLEILLYSKQETRMLKKDEIKSLIDSFKVIN